MEHGNRGNWAGSEKSEEDAEALEAWERAVKAIQRCVSLSTELGAGGAL